MSRGRSITITDSLNGWAASHRIGPLARFLRFALSAATLIALLAHAAVAQQRPVPDTLTGRVVAQDSTPIWMAYVRLKSDDGRELVVVTDTAGRYFATMLSAAGIYELSARAFGYAPFSAVVQRPAGTASGRSRIERDLRMNPVAVALGPIKVVASNPGVRKVSPGERSADWTSSVSERLPVDPGEFGDVAALEPGVVRVGSDGSNLSIAGQSPDQNRTSVDGASYSGRSLPAEGVRSSGVITNTYDVSHGLFSGGEVVATTISGTNLWGGAVSARLDNPALQYGQLPGNPSREKHRLRLSGGGGGPLVRDRLFIYGALDLSHDRSPIAGLGVLDPATLRIFQISPDSARRFVDIARRLGVFSRAASSAGGKSGSDFTSVLGRLDYAFSEQHSLTTRIDWRGSNVSALGSSPLTLPTPKSELRLRDGGVLAQLTSTWRQWANELRIYRSAGNTTADTGPALPTGHVLVMAYLGDGTIAPSYLNFGGAQFPEGQRHSLTEIADDLVRNAENGAHRISAGWLIRDQRASGRGDGNLNGAFAFNSLDDLEHGRPALFTRSLNAKPGEAVRQYGALYLGDMWRSTGKLRLVYGVRMEASRFGERPSISPSALALANTARSQPHLDLLITPRFGFIYDPPEGDWNINGGIGEFGSAVNVESLASLWGETGTNGSSLICIGNAAPTPTWERYSDEPSSIPSRCAGGASVFAVRTPSVTLFDRQHGAPRTWRASLGAGWGMGRRWAAHVDGLIIHGVHLPSTVDLNLIPAPGFSLLAEGARPVYARPDEIDPATGGIAPGASRRDHSLGAVRQIGSLGQSWTEEFVAGANGYVGRALVFFFYTFTRSRFLEGGVAAPGAPDATTAGDPTSLAWEEGAFAPRHVFRLMASGRVHSRLSLSAFASLSSGLPFTPTIGGDINADGFANDRAFVFEPGATTDSVLANDMLRLQATAPVGVRDCLHRQAGRIAEAGSCRTPWSPSLDLRGDYYAIGDVNSRRLIVTLTASNVTAGLDYLLHGSDKLRGWGQYPNPDATLLDVRSFDPARRAFRYAVNPSFGQSAGRGYSRIPFRLVIQARITIGSDPRYQPLMRALEGGRGSTRASARASLSERIKNIPALVLRLTAVDTAALELTLLQRARLQESADSLRPSIEASIDSLLTLVTANAPMTAARRARLQEQAGRARLLVSLSLERTRRILTPEQWAKLPAWIVRIPEENQLLSPEMHMWMSGSGA